MAGDQRVSHESQGPEGDQPADLATVVDEIRREAQRTRASGEYPATLERELDALFEDLVPERLNEHDFEAVLDRAERASLIDLHAPIDDPRRVYSQVKRGVQKLVIWYMDYVVRQLATFASSTTRAVRLLGERVERLEQRHEVLARRLPDVGDDLDLLVRDATAVDPWASVIADALAGVAGRVLHAEAGDGAIVARLREAGHDAYGVDPVLARETPDLRRHGAIDHLLVVGPGSLVGLVLSGITDRATAAAKIALAAQAADVVAPGGRVVIVATSPDAWDRVVPPPLADLAPGRPFHPSTWQLLLERSGFEEIAVHEGTPGADASYLVTARRSG